MVIVEAECGNKRAGKYQFLEYKKYSINDVVKSEENFRSYVVKNQSLMAGDSEKS